jgi:hypothetical protein
MPCPGWPDVQCLGRTGRQFLEDVILRARSAADPRAKDAAEAAARFRDARSPLSCEEQCAKAYAAHAAAQGDPPDWDAVLSALEDPLAVPAAAASLSSGPTVVSEPAAASRSRSPARSPARARRPAKRAKAKKKAAVKTPTAGKRRPAKKGAGGASVAKRSKATRTRGTKRASRTKAAKTRGSRSRPRRRKPR